MSIPSYLNSTAISSLSHWVMAVLLLLLFACSDPTLPTDAENGVAIVDLTVEKELLANVPSCFLSDGSLNASAYVYSGAAVLPGDLGGVGANPIDRIPLTIKKDLNYVFTARFENGLLSEAEKGQGVFYSIAIVCDVANDQPSQVDELTYLKHETYIVAIKSTVVNDFGLINEVNKPSDHLTHDDLVSGLVCNNCHFDSPNHDFLLTLVDHDVVNPDCMTCHTATGIATVASNHLSTISISRDCAECHVDYMWLRVAPVNHDAIVNGCDASNCHAFEKLPTVTHNTSAADADCVVCHITSDWSIPR